ncbi:MAG TPA: tetratricopeptide repeat protein [Thermoanaerobaculia bacterium]|nr:tetratricopeptide repeat protein [Thermoanaerobaculia bacterium]
MKIHPNDSLLEEFAGTLLGGHGSIVRHLSECAGCRARLQRMLGQRPGSLKAKLSKVVVRWPGGRTCVYGAAFHQAEKVFQHRRAAFEQERTVAPMLLAELLRQPPERREMLLRNGRRFQSWGVLELLIDRSREKGFEDPAQGEALARLALTLTERLDADYYGAERIQDLRARVWGQIGNLRRMASDFRGAEEAFKTAFALLRQGTADLLEKAILLDVRASLLREQRRFDEAARLLRRAQRIFLQYGERHRAGKALVKMSTVHEHAGRPDKAIRVLYEALKLIEDERDPRLLLAAQHNLITNLAETGRFMEAQGLLIQARPLYARFQDGWTQNRRRWVEGRIARGLGQLPEAESLLRAARDGFVGEGVTYDVALVSLDLALIYAEQGRTAELKRIAEETMPLFSSRPIHREALAALVLWAQAVRAEMASRELILEVASFLRRARHDPDLRFAVNREA